MRNDRLVGQWLAHSDQPARPPPDRTANSAENNGARPGRRNRPRRPAKQRNLNDYEGNSVIDAAVKECMLQAAALLAHTRHWLSRHRPDLLAKDQ